MRENHIKQSPLLTLPTLGGGSNSFSYGGAADLGLSDSYWFAPYGPGTLGTPHGYGVAIDHNDGSVYAICQHGGAMGATEALLFKFDKSGTMQWRRYLSGNNQEYFKNVAVDSDGNVYISGSSYNSSYGSQTFTTYVQASGTAAWDISGFDRNGTVNGLNPTINIEAGDTMQFSMLNTTGHSFNMQTSPGSGASQVPSSTGPNYGVNRNGATSGYITFYTGGLTSGTYYYHCYNHGLMGGTVVVHPANTYGYAGYGQDDIILAKYNSSGDLQWQRTFGGAQYERQEKGLKVDSSGNVYVKMYGWFNAAGTYVSNYSMGFAKFDSSGNLQLQRAVGYSNWEFYGTGLDIDSSNNVYVCGRNLGTNQYPYAGYFSRRCGVISKWNSSGTWQWTYTISFNYTGWGLQELDLYNVLADDSGNVYACGTLGAVGNWAGNSTSQLFVIKIDSSGNKVWAQRIHTSGTTSGQWSYLALDSEGNLMVTGYGYSVHTGNHSAMIFKINSSNGFKIWSRIIDNTWDTGSNSSATVQDDIARGIAIDAEDNFYINGSAHESGAGLGLVAKLPGDGSLYDTSSPGSSETTKFAARFLYKESMNENSADYTFYFSNSTTYVTVNSDTTYATGFTPQLQARASNLTSIDATGQAVSVGIISDRSTPDATYDYSFPDEVHYGNGSSGSGGSTSYHFSGDGTMPAINLGSSVQNFDMFFELYISKKDRDVSNHEFIICNQGWTSTNGWLFASYSNNVNKEITIGDPNGYSLYTGHPTIYDTPQSAIDNKQYTDQWNWFKLEWRGGTSFKIYHKNSPTKSYTQSVTNMDTPVSIYNAFVNVYNGTNLNYLSIGQGQSYSGSGFSQQFYGRMKNFGINVNSNVVDL
tara:strand:- start:54 stop:2657 length:2604 start_codon:yes stop_codon:yes gene_type:complete